MRMRRIKTTKFRVFSMPDACPYCKKMAGTIIEKDQLPPFPECENDQCHCLAFISLVATIQGQERSPSSS